MRQSSFFFLVLLYSVFQQLLTTFMSSLQVDVITLHKRRCHALGLFNEISMATKDYTKFLTDLTQKYPNNFDGKGDKENPVTI